ncbi:pilin N-terminal domain-containing protein [Enterococcus asini]|uniref:Pilin N-terminal domain-containing protein n=1 Tax=Enterococcus asini TaxID=57732 RepID=A0AAW8U0E4_9ENTE|nr:pilin N-terminal domain-containing protein [Enterococcus asini]MDT2811156.1 pilin N-terminal domain-containing protein [Enterococcus asini]
MRRRKLVTIILGIIMVLPLFLGLGGMKDVMGTEKPNQTVTLHKRKFATMPADKKNTGDLMDDFGGDPLAGAIFTAYDVTTAYWEAYDEATGTDAEKSSAATTAVLALKNTVTGGTAFAATDTDGIATKALPKKSGGRNAIYLFIETTSPAGVVQGASMPFVLGLPVYNEGTDIEKETVHVYPKNVYSELTLGFTKYGVNAEGVLEEGGLARAEFILKGENGSYYNTSTRAFDLTEEQALAQTTQIASAAGGVVSVPNLVLDPGDYEFYEIDSAVSKAGLQAEDSMLYHYAAAKNPLVTAHVSRDMTITYDYYDITTTKQEKQTTASAYNYQVPAPKKDADDKDVDTDQEINFTISQKIPTDIKNYTTFSLIDEFDEELGLVNATDAALLAEIKGSMTSLADLVTGVTISGNTFTVNFDLDSLKAHAGETISFKVKMAVKPGANLDTEIENKITFDNDFAPKTDTDSVKTYGKSFLKIDMDTEEALAGAKFYVKKGDLYLGTRAGKMTWEAPTSTTKGEDGRYPFADGFVAKELTSSAEGKFSVAGLAQTDTNGEITYELEEFVAPDGYALLQNTIEFVADDGTEELPVANKHKGSLPSTGGSGIVAFVLIGVVAVGGAVLYFTKGRRQIEG